MLTTIYKLNNRLKISKVNHNYKLSNYFTEQCGVQSRNIFKQLFFYIPSCLWHLLHLLQSHVKPHFCVTSGTLHFLVYCLSMPMLDKVNLCIYVQRRALRFPSRQQEEACFSGLSLLVPTRQVAALLPPVAEEVLSRAPA